MLSNTDVDHRSPSPVGAPARSTESAPRTTWLRDRIDARVAITVAVAWFVLVQVAVLLEPETTHEMPVVAAVLEVTMWTLLAAMIAGLATRRRWGLLASFGAAVVATAASIACPTTGHHPIGGWWFGQLACVSALVVVSVWALRTRAVSGGGELHEEGARPGA